MTHPAAFPVLTTLNDPADVEADLVVMPFGGGGPSVFLPWARRVPATWRLSAVCLPGRGHRFVEPPHTDAATAAQEVAAAVRARLGATGRPLVYLGHSLGSLLALDVAALVEPDLLCVAGCSPPHPSTPATTAGSTRPNWSAPPGRSLRPWARPTRRCWRRSSSSPPRSCGPT